MNVRFRSISSAPDRAPRIHAEVDGLKVSYRVCSGRPPGDAWRCAEHYRQRPFCEHVIAVMHHLDDDLLERVTDDPMAPVATIGRHPLSGAR